MSLPNNCFISNELEFVLHSKEFWLQAIKGEKGIIKQTVVFHATKLKLGLETI